MTLAPESLAPETTDLKVQLQLDGDWFTVCELTRLLPGRGVAALLPDGNQAALFRDRAGHDALSAMPSACRRSRTRWPNPAASAC